MPKSSCRQMITSHQDWQENFILKDQRRISSDTSEYSLLITLFDILRCKAAQEQTGICRVPPHAGGANTMLLQPTISGLLRKAPDEIVSHIKQENRLDVAILAAIAKNAWAQTRSPPSNSTGAAASAALFSLIHNCAQNPTCFKLLFLF